MTLAEQAPTGAVGDAVRRGAPPAWPRSLHMPRGCHARRLRLEVTSERAAIWNNVRASNGALMNDPRYLGTRRLTRRVRRRSSTTRASRESRSSSDGDLRAPPSPSHRAIAFAFSRRVRCVCFFVIMTLDEEHASVRTEYQQPARIDPPPLQRAARTSSTVGASGQADPSRAEQP